MDLKYSVSQERISLELFKLTVRRNSFRSHSAWCVPVFGLVPMVVNNRINGLGLNTVILDVAIVRSYIFPDHFHIKNTHIFDKL